ncbi:MAG TPA: DUF4249 family protein [Flavitalea sp.]|nr:DUF4249 family protein [Flavitalea sp.]HTF30746.1 DUF4249 family protein [Flavitalea sp.]
MKNTCIYFISFLLLFVMSSCEKVIDLDLADGQALPYIDAWITDKPGVQTIKFLQAANYLDQQQPIPVTDAEISVSDLTINKTYIFNYDNGAYTCDPGSGNKIGMIGHQYKLNIVYMGELFEAIDNMNRVTNIDSITIEFREEDGEEEQGYYAELFATDLSGGTDYSWIRTYRNGSLNQFTNEMVSIDGAFNEGISDGFVFIPPFREGITSSEKPYNKGEEVKVQIRSLSKDSYNFIDQLIEQLYSGGLFAKVLQNVPTNVIPPKNGTTIKIYGWFGVTAEAELAKVIQ